MPHKRSDASKRRRNAKRNLFASLMENNFGKEAGRRVTTVWADQGNGLVPVALVDEELLKPERIHGGILRYDIQVSRKGVRIVGVLPDDEERTTKTVNKRAARLSADFRRRRN